MDGMVALLPTNAGVPAGSPPIAIGSGLLALALSFSLWPFVTCIGTVAHEGGHALITSLMGGKVKSLEVHRSGDGLTGSSGLGPLGRFLTSLAGYVAPSAFGLWGAFLLARDKTAAVIGISLLFLAIALYNMDNWFGRTLIAAIGAAMLGILRYASPSLQTFFAYTWIWLLLFGGFGDVLALQRRRSSTKDSSSDAYQLRKMTFLPASLWSGVFWLASLSALLYGGGLLLGVVDGR